MELHQTEAEAGAEAAEPEDQPDYFSHFPTLESHHGVPSHQRHLACQAYAGPPENRQYFNLHEFGGI